VAGLLHNDELSYTVHGGLGDATSPERVAAELLDLQSGSPGCALEELADRIGVQAAPRNMTVLSNSPEDRALRNPGLVEPLTQRTDRAGIWTGTEGQTQLASGAFLVCLRFADGDDDAVGRELEVRYMDTGELRPAKPARESDQDECAVPKAEKVLTSGGDDPADVGRK
jgi:hypothetical protein